ncbi:MAG TPA: hypothetical protein VM901_04475 [Bdellovibrionota bacterium]|jgi:hypothetical protein|nr:hypothetical protein [Bdellovibrionota bacterium]
MTKLPSLNLKTFAKIFFFVSAAAQMNLALARELECDHLLARIRPLDYGRQIGDLESYAFKNQKIFGEAVAFGGATLTQHIEKILYMSATSPHYYTAISRFIQSLGAFVFKGITPEQRLQMLSTLHDAALKVAVSNSANISAKDLESLMGQGSRYTISDVHLRQYILERALVEEPGENGERTWLSFYWKRCFNHDFISVGREEIQSVQRVLEEYVVPEDAEFARVAEVPKDKQKLELARDVLGRWVDKGYLNQAQFSGFLSYADEVSDMATIDLLVRQVGDKKYYRPALFAGLRRFTHDEAHPFDVDELRQRLYEMGDVETAQADIKRAIAAGDDFAAAQILGSITQHPRMLNKDQAEDIVIAYLSLLSRSTELDDLNHIFWSDPAWKKLVTPPEVAAIKVFMFQKLEEDPAAAPFVLPFARLFSQDDLILRALSRAKESLTTLAEEENPADALLAFKRAIAEDLKPNSRELAFDLGVNLLGKLQDADAINSVLFRLIKQWDYELLTTEQLESLREAVAPLDPIGLISEENQQLFRRYKR